MLLLAVMVEFTDVNSVQYGCPGREEWSEKFRGRLEGPEVGGVKIKVLML